VIHHRRELMKKLTGLALFACMMVLVGCQSTLDKNATLQNDINVQRVTEENDELNAAALADDSITETTAEIRKERNHQTRRLARSMARDAGNKDLPVIPSNSSDATPEPEPEPTDPE
jgi:hypothetical protein